MADKSEKKKGGAGKFFLGAIIGGIAGAVAGRFITAKANGELKEGECDCDGKCECKKEKVKEAVKKVTHKEDSEKTAKK